ncbi:MAG: TIR domain-containing protein [Pirellulales bacterium]|nr:TIR domain-containing protein [Pirellulales bacterium]
MVKLFVSYRRSDSDITGRICDRLQDAFGEESIFKDVDSLLLGHDFRHQLHAAVNACDLMLAVIGPKWVSLTDESGNRRLDHDEDFVRIEIEAALDRDIPIIPLLIHGASMPRAGELPETLRNLAYRHALEVHRDPDFGASVRHLIKQLERVLTSQPARPVPPSAKAGCEKTRAAAEVAGGRESESGEETTGLSDIAAWDESENGKASEEPELTATVAHMHQSVGTLADLILREGFAEKTGRISVAFADPLSPGHRLRRVLLDLSRRPEDAVRYLRLSGLRLGNEWWDESHPVLVRVYRLDRVTSWISAEKAPCARLAIWEKPPVGLVTGESVGCMKGGKFTSVIDAEARVPCIVTRRIKTTKPNQTQIHVRTAAASQEGARFLGASLVVGVLPAPAGEAWIDCAFRVDQDGRVTVTARCPFTSEPTVVVFG